MANWDETAPAAGDLISSGDDEIRQLKTDIRERMDNEHVWTATGTSAEGTHPTTLLDEGDHVPSVTHIQNITSSTPVTVHYLRVKQRVMFSGRFVVVPSSSGVDCVLEWTPLIVASFGSSNDAAGIASANAVGGTIEGGDVQANPANEKLLLSFRSSSTGNHYVNFSGLYEI